MNWNPLNQLSSLKVGDIIRHKGNSEPFVVTGNYGSRVTAVSTVDVTNPIEWEILTDAQPEEKTERKADFGW